MKRIAHPGFGTAIPFERVPDVYSAIRHPERTAYRLTGHLGATVTIAEWPSVGALQTTIALQDRGPSHSLHWRRWIDSAWYRSQQTLIRTRKGHKGGS